MNRPCNEFLSGAGFAANQYRGIVFGSFGRLPDHFGDSPAAAQQTVAKTHDSASAFLSNSSISASRRRRALRLNLRIYLHTMANISDAVMLAPRRNRSTSEW